MNKELENEEINSLIKQLKDLFIVLENKMKKQYNRSLPVNELLTDRWERAKRLSFGEGSSIYDSSLVFGQPNVGKNCWIGPFTIIDGSGGLKIGNNCTISSGVQIYTHDNVKATLSPNYSIERESVSLGDNIYIAPNCIISKGVQLGSHSVVAANSFVNKSFEANSIIAGTPAKIIGKIILENSNIIFSYNK